MLLRWREEELRRPAIEAPVWRLTCMIIANAVRKNATIVFVKKTSPTRCAVLYAIDGAIHEEMTPPVKLTTALIGDLMRFGGPIPIEPGTRSQFELVRSDGRVLTGHLLAGKNEFGWTASLRFTTPPRMLN